jgi:hypothetical protein
MPSKNVKDQSSGTKILGNSNSVSFCLFSLKPMREEAEKVSFSTDLSILHSFPASKQAKLSMMLQSQFHRPIFTKTIPSLAEISIIRCPQVRKGP